MKYGKQYLESLENVPEEWRQQAIEYRKLKKVINRVANELKELGLTSDVLRDLLQAKKAASPPAGPAAKLHADNHVRWSNGNAAPAAQTAGQADSDAKDQGVQTGVQEALDDVANSLAEASEDEVDDLDGLSAKARGKRKATRKRRVHATYELRGTAAQPEPCIHLVFSSCSSTSASESETQSGSRDDSEDPVGSPANFLFKRTARRPSTSSKVTSNGRIVELESSDGDGDLNGTDPVSPASPPGEGLGGPANGDLANGVTANLADRVTPDATESTGSINEDVDPDDDIEFEGAGPQANALLRRMYGVGRAWNEDDDVPAVVEIDQEGEEVIHPDLAHQFAEACNLSPSEDPKTPKQQLNRTLSQETLRSKAPSEPAAIGKAAVAEQQTHRDTAAAAKAQLAEEQGEDADDEEDSRPEPLRRTKRTRRPRQHRREVYIPLTSDTEFLTLLASALNSLATLQLAQKRQFTEAVRVLAKEVSAVSSPSRPKSDLYIWREIFSLWIEADIFESSRERDRGERSIEDVEKHLEWFVDQVAKRKLAKRMKHKESRAALEKFIALNVELLDLKKFQIANEEAARKILKKHDKRTALTASLGFPRLIGSDASNQLSTELISRAADGGASKPVLTLPGFPSLPHILLSTFTSTLLPIIPSIEDYECLICGDLAFKPIRLNCGHRFCVRCLVKMQKRGQDNCPQCRSAVVLRASAANLDHEMLTYLKEWFPREVKEKEKSNHKEAAREELEEMGLKEHKCIIS